MALVLGEVADEGGADPVVDVTAASGDEEGGEEDAREGGGDRAEEVGEDVDVVPEGDADRSRQGVGGWVDRWFGCLCVIPIRMSWIRHRTTHASR